MAKKRKRRPRRPQPRQPASERPLESPGDGAAGGRPRRESAAGGARATGPPPAPWGSFPLSEVVIALALALLLGGFFVAPPRGAVMIGTGLVLGSLAGLELAVREHFSGYRSHTTLLSGAIGVAVLAGLLSLTGLGAGVCVGAGVASFALAAWLFANAFRSRSGGALFRFGGG